MTIEIHSPEAEAIIRPRMSASGSNAEDVIIEALMSSLAAEASAFVAAAQKPLLQKTLVELCDPARGLMDDIDFNRNPSAARPLDL
jgi:hypothetical protein